MGSPPLARGRPSRALSRAALASGSPPLARGRPAARVPTPESDRGSPSSGAASCSSTCPMPRRASSERSCQRWSATRPRWRSRRARRSSPPPTCRVPGQSTCRTADCHASRMPRIDAGPCRGCASASPPAAGSSVNVHVAPALTHRPARVEDPMLLGCGAIAGWLDDDGRADDHRLVSGGTPHRDDRRAVPAPAKVDADHHVSGRLRDNHVGIRARPPLARLDRRVLAAQPHATRRTSIWRTATPSWRANRAVCEAPRWSATVPDSRS